MSDYETAMKKYSYDEETGLLHHKRTRAAISAGDVAGTLNSDGYIRVGMNNKQYRAHRLIWLMKTGSWPPTSIDHIDRNKTNNRWSNLRLATPRQQQANLTPSKRNTSGARGVSFAKGKWVARLATNGSWPRNCGTFSTFEEAKAAYDAAARRYFGEFYQPEPLPIAAALRQAAGGEG